jgi:hypothetical protein
MYKYANSETYRLSSKEEILAKARELKDLGSTNTEREEKDKRKKNIKNKLLSGQSIVFHWATGTVHGIAKRVNGQHSAEVFLELSDEEWEIVEQYLPIVIIIIDYSCDTEQDRAYLFNQFDPGWSSRNTEDNVGVHMALEPDLVGMTTWAGVKASQGLIWYYEQVEEWAKQNAEAYYAIFHQNSHVHRFLHYLRDIKLQKNRHKELAMRPVIGAMFHTIRSANPMAEAFWRQISGGAGAILDGNSIEHKLADFLGLAANHDAKWPADMARKFTNKRRPNDIEIFSTCLRLYTAHANHVVHAETFERLKVTTAKEVVELLLPLKQAA